MCSRPSLGKRLRWCPTALAGGGHLYNEDGLAFALFAPSGLAFWYTHLSAVFYHNYNDDIDSASVVRTRRNLAQYCASGGEPGNSGVFCFIRTDIQMQ